MYSIISKRVSFNVFNVGYCIKQQIKKKYFCYMYIPLFLHFARFELKVGMLHLDLEGCKVNLK